MIQYSKFSEDAMISIFRPEPNQDSADWRLGYEDGKAGRPKSTLGEVKTDYNYTDGWSAGDAVRLGDCEPMTEEERMEIYGDEKDRP